MVDRRIFDSGLQSFLGIGGGGVGIHNFSEQLAFSMADSGADTTDDDTAQAVDLDNTIYWLTDHYHENSFATTDWNFGCTLENVDSDTWRVTNGANNGNFQEVAASVLEYSAGVINSIQEVSTTMVQSTNTSNVTISSVDTSKTVILPLGNRWNTAAICVQQDINAQVTLTSATNLRFIRNQSGRSGTMQAHALVVEYV